MEFHVCYRFITGCDLVEKLSLSWLTSPFFELREKFKCIEHTRKCKIWTTTWKCRKTSPCLKALGWILIYKLQTFFHFRKLLLHKEWILTWFSLFSSLCKMLDGKLSEVTSEAIVLLDLATKGMHTIYAANNKVLIRLRECAGSSAPLLFTYGINSWYFLMTWLNYSFHYLTLRIKTHWTYSKSG